MYVPTALPRDSYLNHTCPVATPTYASSSTQVRGKKNVVLDQSLVGPIGTIVKVATLQEYGVDKFFILENDNADTSQRNVVFISRGECGRHAEAIAGLSTPSQPRDCNLTLT